MSKIPGILLKYVLVGFLVSTVIKGIQCKPKLSIVQNVSAMGASAPFAIDIKNGTNFSLTCKISGTQMKHMLFWAKAIKTSSSGTKIQVQVSKHRPNAILNFLPVTFTNQGTYFCASPKHQLAEVVYIFVVKDVVRSSSKWKRSTIDYKPIFNKSTDHVLFEYPRVPIYSDVQKDIDEFLRKFPDNDHNSWSKINENPSGASFSDINSFEKIHEKHQRELDQTRKRKNAYFWKALVGMFALAIICGLIYLARKCYEDQFSPVDINTSNIQTPLVTFSNHHTVTDVADSTRPLNIRLFRNLDHLALPPTYADSVENSRASSMNSLGGTNTREGSQNLNSNNDEDALLPTYEEALASRRPSAPSYCLLITDR